MGIVLGLAAIILVVALTTGQSQASAPTGPGIPEFVRKVMADVSASREDLLRAADEAEKAGYPQLAQALRQRAQALADSIPSPWKDVSSPAWTRFCALIVGKNKPTSISPKGFFGLFQMSVRRLVDLGIMSNPKSKQVETFRVWSGDWVVPQEKFMTDPNLQYRMFGKSMDLYRNIISEKFKQVLGLNIEGKPATLSGLLALSHMASSEGMHKWLTDGTIRTKFTWATDAYNRTNGIF